MTADDSNRPVLASDLASPTREQYLGAVADRAAALRPTRNVSDATRAAILAAFQQGVAYASIANAHSMSPPKAASLIAESLPEEVPGMGLVAGKSRLWLGQGAIDWAIAHPQLTVPVRDAVRAAGWDAQTSTVILLALAKHEHAALAAQTGGEAPTMRTALYRMMAGCGVPKAAYAPLSNQTAVARKNGVLPRDFWADSEPSTVIAPQVWTVAESLEWAFEDLARPSDPLARTGHVFGVVTETRGAAPALAGAIEQRLGFEIPVWHTGGMGSLPRRLHIEEEMQEWAQRTGAEPHLLVITDYDPSGIIIANAIAEEVRDVDVRRIGMLPDLAPSASLTSSGIKEHKEGDTHRKSALWKDAVDEYGDDEFQAEAVDYAGWAGHIADAIEEHIDLADAVDEYGPEWDDLDRLMASLRKAMRDSDSDPAGLLDELGL